MVASLTTELTDQRSNCVGIQHLRTETSEYDPVDAGWSRECFAHGGHGNFRR